MIHTSEFRVVLCTCGSAAEASAVARGLVEREFAACVNIVPAVRSVYRWQGAVEEADEHLLLIKTRADLLAAVEATIRELHNYEVPEVLVLEVMGGSNDYLGWLAANLQVQSSTP
ncbi:MAG: divalent-cation tolerance protein CutA [Bryobacterales bacterium]|nr:divalent-cation tolerance protein CutA [Bryobacterales bacterium]